MPFSLSEIVEVIAEIGWIVLYIAIIVAGCFAVFATFWIPLELYRVSKYQKKISQLYDDMEKELDNARYRPIPTEIINRQIAKIREDYKPRIEKLEREKQFILEKLPFIKK